MTQESIHFDVLIVGAGPAGLSAAVRLAQLSQAKNRQLSICVVEKAAEVGAHSLSGAILDPKALNELLPDWQKRGAPLMTPAEKDSFLFLTEKKSWHLPTPSVMRNQGNYMISLGHFCLWLAAQAQQDGVNIFPGFAAVRVLYDEAGKVCGVATGDKGRDKQGQPTSRYQAGIHIYATQTLFAEGCRGSLSKTLIKHFQLDRHSQHQTYALGIKELWEIPDDQHHPGHALHSVGWPLDQRTYGGSFLYHLEKNQIAIGFVVGLDYANPYLDPYEELQRFKTHPDIRNIFKNGRRLSYGARALNEGGWQTIPNLSFPGGMLIGDSAGFLNVPRIKGIHTSMKSGMIAAELLMETESDLPVEVSTFRQTILQSWVGEELYAARNIRPAFHGGLWAGLAYSALDLYLFKGRVPWTMHYNRYDHQCFESAKRSHKIVYPKHDNVLTFDKLTSVYASNTHHQEDQPCHLVLKHPDLAVEVNYRIYDSPETRYCPAGVYEMFSSSTPDVLPRLQINAANCVHCKACDIKDPKQNINWHPPEGGNGPNYGSM